MAKRVTLRKSLWREDQPPPPPAPDYGPQMSALMERMNQLQAQVSQIPPPDMKPIIDEISDIRSDLTQMQANMAQPAQWDFDIQRSGGRISSVTATRSGETPEPKREVNVLDLYKT